MPSLTESMHRTNDDATTRAPWRMRLPLSHIRAWGARRVYRLLRLVLRKDRYVITRGGIRYEVDLAEGLDLSLYVFGQFEKHVAEPKYFTLRPDAVIFDVGANSGIMSLAFARQCPQGTVYAFEPTDYAFAKLRRNLELNPGLATRIQPIKTFVTDCEADTSNLQAYASWRIDRPYAESHPVHCGLIQSACQTGEMTVDGFCRRQELKRLDLFKIDTDGHELCVLKGAQQTLAQFHPVVIFEAGLYLMRERGIEIADYIGLLRPLGYCLVNAMNGVSVDAGNYRRHIPERSTTDLLALPSEAAAVRSCP